MDIQIELAFIGLVQAIVVAFIGGIFALNSKKNKEAFDKSEEERKKDLSKVEVRAALRAEESKIIMQMISASMKLGEANMQAIKTGNPNGELDKAMELTQKADQSYQQLLLAYKEHF